MATHTQTNSARTSKLNGTRAYASKVHSAKVEETTVDNIEPIFSYQNVIAAFVGIFATGGTLYYGTLLIEVLTLAVATLAGPGFIAFMIYFIGMIIVGIGAWFVGVKAFKWAYEFDFANVKSVWNDASAKVSAKFDKKVEA